MDWIDVGVRAMVLFEQNETTIKRVQQVAFQAFADAARTSPNATIGDMHKLAFQFSHDVGLVVRLKSDGVTPDPMG